MGGKRVDVSSAVEGINVDHHGTGPMNGCPSVREEFLGPSAELVAWSVVSGDFVDSVAVADPVEVGAP